ncbi:hypothetical protein Tco_1449957 [Tanacetum coccineum]
MLSILEFEERQSNDRTRILVNTLDSEFSTLEIHYSNTWVMLRSQLLKERLHKTDRLKQCKIDSSKVREDTNADDADIRPIYDEEPMAELKGNSGGTKFDKTSALGETGVTITKKPISC